MDSDPQRPKKSEASRQTSIPQTCHALRRVSRTHHERPWCIGFHIKLYMLSHIGLGCWILYQYHVRSWQIHEVRSTKSRLLSNMVKRQIYNYNNGTVSFVNDVNVTFRKTHVHSLATSPPSGLAKSLATIPYSIIKTLDLLLRLSCPSSR